MSEFFKAKQFSEEAKDAERRMFDENGNLRDELLPPPEPETTPEPEPTPEPTPGPEPKPEPPVETDSDKKYKEAVRAMNEAQRKAADLEKATKAQAEKQAELEARLKELTEAKQVVPAEPEDDLETDLPEVTKLAERKAKQAVDPVQKELDDIKKRLAAEEERIKKATQEDAGAKIYAEVTKAFPDYDTLIASEELQTWLTTDAPPIYKAIYDGAVPSTAKDIVEVLSRFKSSLVPTKVVADTPTDKATAAKTVVTPSSKGNKPAPLTEAEIRDFQNNVHRWDAKRKADFNARLESMFTP